MLKYEILIKNPSLFTRIFGLKVHEFDLIVQKVSQCWDEYVTSKYKRPGRFHKLNVRSMLMVLLLYYRHYVTQEFVGMLFGVDAATVCRIIKKLEPILVDIMQLPERDGLQQDELGQIIIDATENPIERPKVHQELYYSGKKKRHTVKTEVRITTKGRVIDISETVPGAIHDFELFKRGKPIPQGTRAYADSGYQGIKNIHAESEHPYKKPRNGKLTSKEVKYNRALARLRVKVEEILGDIKVFRIMSNRYRNKRKRFNEKIRIIAGIVNLRNGFGFA
jgi:hypothetical protein